MAWDLPLSLRPYRQGFSSRKEQNLPRSSCASSLAGDRWAPGAVSPCAGLRGRGRVKGGQLGRACGVQNTVCAPKPEGSARPLPSIPTWKQGDGQGLLVSAIDPNTEEQRSPAHTLGWICV